MFIQPIVWPHSLAAQKKIEIKKYKAPGKPGSFTAYVMLMTADYMLCFLPLMTASRRAVRSASDSGIRPLSSR